MPKPLKRKKGDGTRYERPPEIEGWLEKLDRIEPLQRTLQFETLTKRVPSEALVYFLRRAWVEDAHGEFEKIFRILLKRVERSLRSVLSESRIAGAREIREEIMGRFAELIAKDCKKCDVLLDIYEIRFDMAFARFRKSVLRQIGPSAVNTVPLYMDEDDGLEISAEVEVAAADFLSGDPSKLDDPAFRFKLTAAIDSLPDDQKQVIGLLLQDFQIDSKDTNAMTISRILKCDERTVRNRRDRAFKSLKSILQEEFAT